MQRTYLSYKNSNYFLVNHKKSYVYFENNRINRIIIFYFTDYQ
ncbi:hypothetical protein CCAND95_100013 [Capnocytophaga canis]|uniref:Uncharacterized protein n=1 Tax=Capnocytophaga canis TaxID=1848903 RepID=A0A0B7HS29_9FLAO|nr:hypothetical protein CCAND95_100013 [Capnocytophaga canis]CEN46610.1 hypothetical protein CCAND38_370033 [Capnocytophaga canis]CEN50618.1 hypothetical protein CCAND93_120010 [Capnocytophaga canis]